jgi:hypothetical protein
MEWIVPVMVVKALISGMEAYSAALCYARWSTAARSLFIFSERAFILAFTSSTVSI